MNISTEISDDQLFNIPKKILQRPVFYLDPRNKIKPCKGGGVLPYLMRDGVVYLLMIKCNDRYEDFGGKTIAEDKSIKETIAREVSEESNKIISAEYISENTKGQGIYLPASKYLLYFIKADEDYDTEIFGTKEIGGDVSRTVEWIDMAKINKNREINIHPRLCNKRFFEGLLFLQLDHTTF